jgi:pfkB family carbohydrate kinase
MLNWTINMAGRIAVIGGTNLDIIGQSYDRRENLDKLGSVQMVLGGAAFKAAIYLAREGRKVPFWTALKRHSVVSKWFIRKLKDEGIDAKHITLSKDAGSGTFLAIKHQGEHLDAVTQVGMENMKLPDTVIRRAVKRAGAVLADCNLSVTQLAALLGICSDVGRPISILGISEALALHFVNAAELAKNARSFALSVDNRSLESIRKHVSNRGLSDDREIPKYLRVRVISVFEGLQESADQAGYQASFRMLFDDGSEERVVEYITGRARTTGGRDAVGAALADLSSRIDRDAAANQIVHEFRRTGLPIVVSVLRGERANLENIPVGATLETFGLETDATPWYVELWIISRSIFAQFAQLVIVLLTLLAAFSQAFPEKMKPILDVLWKFFGV